MPPTRIVETLAIWNLVIGDNNPNQPSTTQSFVGIIVAIAGNIVISLALNCQKLAHWRLEKEHNATTSKQEEDADTSGRTDGEQEVSINLDEAAPLLDQSLEGRGVTYGTARAGSPGNQSLKLEVKTKPPAPKLLQRLSSTSNRNGSSTPRGEALIPIAAADVRVDGDGTPDSYFPDVQERDSSTPVQNGDAEQGTERGEGDYLKSKLWWFGFALMNVGEIGNFLSYGLAPASVVAPLGAFALIANCIFAPLMLGERFHRKDLAGMLLAMFGAVTIVASAQTSSPHLNPRQLLEALQEPVFLVYVGVVVACALILGYASGRKWGEQWVSIDVGLCALFGGFTVLSTKALSSLLTLEWLDIFKEWITYPLCIVLLGTGIGQIRYLNRALMKFDAKHVIPTQFVLFNFSAIIGSAILYGDFRRVNFHQFIVFLYGCAATFAGVYLLTVGPSERESDTDEASAREERAGGLPAIPEEASNRSDRPTSLPIRVLRKRKSSAAAGAALSPGQYLLFAAPILTTSSPTRRPSLERERRNSTASIPRTTERGRTQSLSQR